MHVKMASLPSGSFSIDARHASTGDVGLLAEEEAQRLLAILSETVMTSLRQIHLMSIKHGAVKYNSLFDIGLGVIKRWDDDVVQEETLRLETLYPEASALHSYVFLWLLERLTTDVSLLDFSVPPISDVFSRFVKRVVAHSHVAQGNAFMSCPEPYRRAVFVEAFRNAYHDIVRQSQRSSQRYTAANLTLLSLRKGTTNARDARATPGAEAAHTAESTQSLDRDPQTANAGATGPQPSALHLAMNNQSVKAATNSSYRSYDDEEHGPPPAFVMDEPAANPLPEIAGSVASEIRGDGPAESCAHTEGTKAITVSPCFFHGFKSNIPTRTHPRV